MHEFSIARSIVDIAEDEVRNADAINVQAIELDIGKLAGIDLNALNFVWDAAVEHSVLQKAKKTIHLISGVGYCSGCGTEFHIEQIFDKCPKCHQFNTVVKRGDELKIKSLTLNV